jgi:putative ABC transport system ATP-binding protein
MCKDLNTTVIIVTHNEILSSAADKTIKIKNGKIESITVNPMPKKVSQLEL